MPGRAATPRRARGSSASVGCGGSGALPGVPSRSTPMTSRSSSSAACALARMTRRGLGDLLGGGVGMELERAGVQAQQRDAVGQDVVHLARDAQALGLAGLLDAQALLGLQRARALAQREHELALDADEQPPADHDAGDQHAERRSAMPYVLVARVEQREDRGGGQRRARPSPRIARRDPRMATLKRATSAGPPAAPETSEQTPAMTPTATRVRAAEPQRHEGDRAEREVDGEREPAVVAPRWRPRTSALRPAATAYIARSTTQSRAERRPSTPSRSSPGSSMRCQRGSGAWSLGEAVMVSTAYARLGAADPRPKSTRTSTPGRGGGGPRRRSCRP